MQQPPSFGGGPREGAAHESARERPICIALVICDDVIEDKRTGNKSLIGLFNSVSTAQLPAIHPRMYLVASLTDGRGAWEFSFRITAPSGREVMRMVDTLESSDPLVVHDLVVELRSLPIEEEGVYFVDLVVGDTPLANRRFTVSLGSETPDPR